MADTGEVERRREVEKPNREQPVRQPSTPAPVKEPVPV